MEREQMRTRGQQYPGRQTANEEALLRILLARLKREDVDFLLVRACQGRME